jgi:predicted extracellular nuclease
MNKLLLISFVTLLLSGCFTNKKVTKNKDNFITVVSYNVENLYDYDDDLRNSGDDDFLPTSAKQWTKERYEKKVADLAKVIYSIDSINLPALVGLSEVENKKVVIDLANNEKLKSGNYYIVHEESPDERGIDVAFMYKQDIFKYIKHQTIELNFKEDTTDKTRDILYIKGLIENDTFHVFVNHWSSRSGGQEESEFKRIAAASLLRNFIDSIFIIEPLANIIIMGDMNDEPQNTSLDITLNAKNNKLPKSNTELFNMMFDKDLINQGSYSYKGDWNMIDNLVVSKNLLEKKSGYKVDYTAGEVFNADFILYYNTKIDEKTPNKTYGGDNYYGGYSDHLPIYMKMYK